MDMWDPWLRNILYYRNDDQLPTLQIGFPRYHCTRCGVRLWTDGDAHAHANWHRRIE